MNESHSNAPASDPVLTAPEFFYVGDCLVYGVRA